MDVCFLPAALLAISPLVGIGEAITTAADVPPGPVYGRDAASGYKTYVAVNGTRMTPEEAAPIMTIAHKKIGMAADAVLEALMTSALKAYVTRKGDETQWLVPATYFLKLDRSDLLTGRFVQIHPPLEGQDKFTGQPLMIAEKALQIWLASNPLPELKIDPAWLVVPDDLSENEVRDAAQKFEAAGVDLNAMRKRYSVKRKPPPPPEAPTIQRSSVEWPLFSSSWQDNGSGFWDRHHRVLWPRDRGNSVFLGRAALALGRAMYAEVWDDDDPARPMAWKIDPDRSKVARWTRVKSVFDKLGIAGEDGELIWRFRPPGVHKPLKDCPTTWLSSETYEHLFYDCRVDHVQPDRINLKPFRDKDPYLYVDRDGLIALVENCACKAAAELEPQQIDYLKEKPRRLANINESRNWYIERKALYDAKGIRPSRAEDEAAGRTVGLSRTRVRELRDEIAPEWTGGGRPPKETRT